MDLLGRVVLVTGATRHIGRTIALELARRGADIAFSWHRADEPFEESAAAIEETGSRVFMQRCDMTQSEQVRALVENTVKHLGRIDVLVNNASIWLTKPAMEISPSEWDTVMANNVRGPFIAAQSAARHMLRQNGGVIINIADLSAFQVWPYSAHHAASRAALISLTKSLAVELAPTIRVNAIAPGTVLLSENESEAKRLLSDKKSILARVGTPEDVAKTVIFLIEMDFATGSVYFIDGGKMLV